MIRIVVARLCLGAPEPGPAPAEPARASPAPWLTPLLLFYLTGAPSTVALCSRAGARDRCRRPHLLLPRGRSLPAPVWAVHPAQPPGRAPAPPAAPWPRLPPLLCCSPAALSGNTAPMSGRAPLCHHAPAPWPAPCCCLAPGRRTGPPPAFACRGRPASPAVATASSRVLASKPHPRGPSPVQVRP